MNYANVHTNVYTIVKIMFANTNIQLGDLDKWEDYEFSM